MNINGTKQTYTIYSRPAAYCPFWCKEDTTFSEIFQRKYDNYPLFSIYRDENLPLAKDPVDYYGKDNYKWHPADFINNEVHVVISEFDKAKTYERVPFEEHEKRVKIIEKTGITYDQLAYGTELYLFYQAMTLKIYNNLRADKRILFCYITGSGLGIRFALYSKNRLTRENYNEFCKSWSEALQKQYDPENHLRTDPNGYSGDLTWWLPKYKQYIWVNQKCQTTS